MEDAGTVLELVRRPLVPHPPALEDVRRFASESARWANCSISSTPAPLGRDGLDRRHETLDDDGRKAERELVDEQRARPRDEGLREHDHLLLASRQRAGPAPSSASRARGRARGRMRSRSSRRCTRESAYVATRRLSSTVSAGSSRRPSGTTATPAARIRSGRLPREVGVAEQDLAGSRAQHAGDGEHERRLAGAVRAEQRRHLARRDRRARRPRTTARPPRATDSSSIRSSGFAPFAAAHSSSSVPR